MSLGRSGEKTLSSPERDRDLVATRRLLERFGLPYEPGRRPMVELPSSDAMDGDRIRVLIADPWWNFREGAAQAIETWPEYEVVAAVTDEECVTTLQNLRPDVALIDPTDLSDANEQVIFTHIRDSDARVLFLSRGLASESCVAIASGVLGYLPKSCDMDDLRDALAAAAIGGSYFTRASLSKLLKETSAPDRPQLTDREREVLVLLAMGRTRPANRRRARSRGVHGAVTSPKDLSEAWRVRAGRGGCCCGSPRLGCLSCLAPNTPAIRSDSFDLMTPSCPKGRIDVPSKGGQACDYVGSTRNHDSVSVRRASVVLLDR